jgi:hypothetical protein
MGEAHPRTAADVVDIALETKPELIVHNGNLPGTAAALRDLLATSDRLFERGVPVRIISQSNAAMPAALALARSNVVMEAHGLCQPVKAKPSGEMIDVTLPDRVATMYLDMVGEWKLRVLDGISMSPVLAADGGLRAVEGYDAETHLWCYRPPNLALPHRPSRADAELALRLLRHTFRTFPFADSARTPDRELGAEVVDISSQPGRDESAFLAALMTACCRSSLWLAPAVLVTAPTLSGAGAGKGLLVRAVCTIAFGTPPRAFTTGGKQDELEKRFGAEFVQAQPAVFLDNANGLALRSDTLASVLTERPAGVRVLGETRMVQLNSTAFVAVTGNGLTLSEDLARRFIVCELDAHCEDPETRYFPGNFLRQVERRRAELLTAVLTIWRWGRQNVSVLAKGKPLGSFETWGEWCRDPLLALGCRDPVERIEALKANDPRRQLVIELFGAWWEHHGDKRLAVSDLADSVKAIADPQNKGRQYLAKAVADKVGTNAGGFVLQRHVGSGRWAAATYVLSKIEPPGGIGHRVHRGHRADAAPAGVPADPMTPMNPMPYEVGDDVLMPGEETAL